MMKQLVFRLECTSLRLILLSWWSVRSRSGEKLCLSRCYVTKVGNLLSGEINHCFMACLCFITFPNQTGCFCCLLCNKRSWLPCLLCNKRSWLPNLLALELFTSCFPKPCITALHHLNSNLTWEMYNLERKLTWNWMKSCKMNYKATVFIRSIHFLIYFQLDISSLKVIDQSEVCKARKVVCLQLLEHHQLEILSDYQVKALEWCPMSCL